MSEIMMTCRKHGEGFSLSKARNKRNKREEKLFILMKLKRQSSYEEPILDNLKLSLFFCAGLSPPSSKAEPGFAIG